MPHRVVVEIKCHNTYKALCIELAMVTQHSTIQIQLCLVPIKTMTIQLV